MSNYLSNICLEYNIQPRTFKRRANIVGLKAVMPKIGIHKALFDENDYMIIKQYLGPPERCIRYFRKA